MIKRFGGNGLGVLRPQAVPPEGQPPPYGGDVNNLYEEVGEKNAVGVSGFSSEGGRSKRSWQITPRDFTELNDSITDILGECAYDATGTGKLNRTLPLCDPVHPWLYASAIPTIQGYGTSVAEDAEPTLETPGFPRGALWDHYTLGVESMPRPFAVAPDYQIPTTNGSYYKEGVPTAIPFVFAYEQLRYCSWTIVPQQDYITRQRGRMGFNASDLPANTGFQAQPRVYLPNSLFRIKWHYVPVRLMLSANSYLKRWRGTINQNAFYGPDGDRFDPGSLLYLNFTPEIYTPPVQRLVGLGGGTSVVSVEKFMNVTLDFLFTERTLYTSPAVPPTDNNYVVGGHNLLPWSDGNFRYADVGSSPRRPTWLSAPLETLFTDCDSPGGVP